MNFKFNINQIVFHKTDRDQRELIITGIVIRQDGIMYIIRDGVLETEFYEFELTEEVDPVKRLVN